MASIFFSYRREDSAYVVELISEELDEDYGDEIFTDVDRIPFGVDFRDSLVGALSRCKVVLAVIGKNWLDIKDKKGQRRLDDPTDHLRIEIETALQRKIPIIPLLVGGAEMPSADELPDTLKQLSYRNGMPIRAGRDTKGDLALLKDALKQILQEPVPERDEQEKSKDQNPRKTNGQPVPFVTTTPPVPGFFSKYKIVLIITLSAFSILVVAGILFFILRNVRPQPTTNDTKSKNINSSPGPNVPIGVKTPQKDLPSLPDNFDWVYTGQSNRPLTLRLQKNGNRLSGTAETPGDLDTLDGNINPDGSFDMEGTNQNSGSITGNWRGRISPDGSSIHGVWTSMSGKKINYRVSLSK